MLITAGAWIKKALLINPATCRTFEATESSLNPSERGGRGGDSSNYQTAANCCWHFCCHSTQSDPRIQGWAGIKAQNLLPWEPAVWPAPPPGPAASPSRPCGWRTCRWRRETRRRWTGWTLWKTQFKMTLILKTFSRAWSYISRKTW